MIRKPSWIKKSIPLSGIASMQNKLKEDQLHSVCEEAKCPNLPECFSKGIATVMIMGDICTRSCKFCSVKTGKPFALDPHEPEHVANWAKNLKLKHLVITSVDRDDLADLGATHFASTINYVKKACPQTIIEVLTPDFQGRELLINQICKANPIIFNHNLETVKRLTPHVRSAAKYDQSLKVIRHVKKNYPSIITKSGLMLGLGETESEILEAMYDLKLQGCDLLTLGQYLQPTANHFPVMSYVHPQKFEEYKLKGIQMGFQSVFSGPFVRSSYLAEELYQKIQPTLQASVFFDKISHPS